MRRHCQVVASLTLVLVASFVNGEYVCDYDAIQDNVKASKLTPNMFHKICPPQTSGTFGQPGCGDGTAFSFFFAKPPQKKANDRKILIEFFGGGACWDSETCALMSDALTFPEKLSNFVGLSCSEIQYGASNGDGDTPINMLCAQQVGDVDFTEYNTVAVPYCTQDVHLGDNTMVYEQGETIYHKGAHNMFSVLRWIFANFKDPSHIALTGCSAGGTVLPVAYDLINKHYNSFLKGGRSVQINVMSDSPVYLTPDYFLQYGLGNWDPSNAMKRIHFRYERNRYNEEYPTLVWNHVLKRGSNRDQWGLVTHTDDPVSLQYFQYMSGSGGDEDGDGNNGDGYSENQWWSELSSSISTIQNKHRNVDTFLMESQGHCSFGLYYALQVDGFEDWASGVFHEKSFLGAAHRSVPLFCTSIVLGVVIVAAVFYSAKNGKRPLQLQESVPIFSVMKLRPQWIQSLISFLLRFKTFPITAGYSVTITIYFVAMLIVEGFAHPLNNPSLGPSAQGLSNFGINNPALIVYKMQYFRLITSNFLCSGILTYLMVVFCLWKQTRYIEERVNNPKVFTLVSCSILAGSNLFYAGVVNGASCAGLSLILGLNAFSVAMDRKMTSTRTAQEEDGWQNSHQEASQPVVSLNDSKSYSPPENSSNDRFQTASAKSDSEFVDPPSMDQGRSEIGVGNTIGSFPKPWVTTVLFTFMTCILFPFNSWVMLLSAMAVGSLVAPLLFKCDDPIGLSSPAKANATLQLRTWPWTILGAAYLLMFLLLLFRIRKPDEKYKYPYLTGCELVYSTEVSDIVSSYTGGNDNGDRDLSEDEGNDDDFFSDTCAQLCIPHVAYRPALWGVKKVVQFSIDEGTCEESGYEVHLADKTFSFMAYSLDVELYSIYGGYDERF